MTVGREGDKCGQTRVGNALVAGGALAHNGLLQHRGVELEPGVAVERGALGGELGDERVRPSVGHRLLVEALLRLRQHERLERLQKVVGHVGRVLDPGSLLGDAPYFGDGACRLLEVLAGQLHALRVAPVLQRGQVRERGCQVEQHCGALVSPVWLRHRQFRAEGVVPAEGELGLSGEVDPAEVVGCVGCQLVVVQRAISAPLCSLDRVPKLANLFPPRVQFLYKRGTGFPLLRVDERREDL